MEVPRRHARTRGITRDTLSPANQPVRTGGHASRDVARVVSDGSVLCPRADAKLGNAPQPCPLANTDESMPTGMGTLASHELSPRSDMNSLTTDAASPSAQLSPLTDS